MNNKINLDTYVQKKIRDIVLSDSDILIVPYGHLFRCYAKCNGKKIKLEIPIPSDSNLDFGLLEKLRSLISIQKIDDAMSNKIINNNA